MTDGDILPRRQADLAYFQRRAEQEVRRAQTASDPAVVAAHFGLAEIYLDRVSELREPAGGDCDPPADIEP